MSRISNRALLSETLLKEALAEVRVAMEAWLETAREAGLALPEPCYGPQHEAAE